MLSRQLWTLYKLSTLSYLRNLHLLLPSTLHLCPRVCHFLFWNSSKEKRLIILFFFARRSCSTSTSTCPCSSSCNSDIDCIETTKLSRTWNTSTASRFTSERFESDQRGREWRGRRRRSDVCSRSRRRRRIRSAETVQSVSRSLHTRLQHSIIDFDFVFSSKIHSFTSYRFFFFSSTPSFNFSTNRPPPRPNPINPDSLPSNQHFKPTLSPSPNYAHCEIPPTSLFILNLEESSSIRFDPTSSSSFSRPSRRRRGGTDPCSKKEREVEFIQSESYYTTQRAPRGWWWFRASW